MYAKACAQSVSNLNNDKIVIYSESKYNTHTVIRIGANIVCRGRNECMHFECIEIYLEMHYANHLMEVKC